MCVSLVWVTGISGSGKSSVCDALRAESLHAIDADWDGFNHWVHRVTGEVMVDPPYPIPPGWLDQFAWRISVERVRSLAAAPSAGVTFLCGSVENEVDVWQYFDRVVCLVADDETIRHRLTTRTTNEFGKRPEELSAALGWNSTIEGRYRALGAAIIDATRPLSDVVRDVLVAARSG